MRRTTLDLLVKDLLAPIVETDGPTSPGPTRTAGSGEPSGSQPTPQAPSRPPETTPPQCPDQAKQQPDQ
jgi:hypothetical protein